jgi:hypothetical protein
MEKLSNILSDLCLRLSAEDLAERWAWVPVEEEKVLNLMNFKISADQHFKNLNYKAALHNYANALKVLQHTTIYLLRNIELYCTSKHSVAYHPLAVCFLGGHFCSQVELYSVQQ